MSRGKVVGYTTGVFDMLHVGHVNILQGARELCDYLIVGVTTDELSLERKGRLPIIPFLERLALVQNLRYVDEVVPQASMDKMAAWRVLSYDVVFVGDDWRGTPFWQEFQKELEVVGGRVEFLPYTQTVSTSALRRRIFSEGN